VPILEQVLEKYPQEVKLVFKNFPLKNHKFAQSAAIAAHAAGKQGRFWEFHDLLFKNYNRLNAQKVKQIARQLNLDLVQFEKDQKDPQIRALITRDLSDAARAGVRATPTVFINGRLLRNRKLPGFQNMIEKELKKINWKKK
jgi:protein-disulfide isomerase